MLKICMSYSEIVFKFIRWILLTFKLKYKANSMLYSELEIATSLVDRLFHSCYNSPCFGSFRFFMTFASEYFFFYYILIFLTLFFS